MWFGVPPSRYGEGSSNVFFSLKYAGSANGILYVHAAASTINSILICQHVFGGGKTLVKFIVNPNCKINS